MTSAVLDNFVFPCNPDALQWGYKLNINDQDTLGGRVLQILSVNITSMSWQGSAINRANLLSIVTKVEQIMAKQVATERPVSLIIPSKNWSFNVYVTGMPRIGWDVSTVTYPYQLALEVDEGFGGLSQIVMQNELDRLAQNIGYDPNWHGPINSTVPPEANDTDTSATESLASPTNNGSSTVFKPQTLTTQPTPTGAWKP